MNRLYIVKIGGNVLDDPGMLHAFLGDFSYIREPKILVHGGGKIATTLGNQLGIASRYAGGRRITDESTLDLVTMVYGGLVNKQLVATLQNLNCNALGLTGADGNLIHATKRPVADIDYGYAGDLTPGSVNTGLLISLLKENIVPIIAPLTHGEGKMLNTNADTIASALAVALSRHFSVRLIYCFEKKGVLQDVNKEVTLIRQLNTAYYQQLLNQGAFADGILPKLSTAFHAIQQGVKEIVIGEAGELKQNLGQETSGTLIIA